MNKFQIGEKVKVTVLSEFQNKFGIIRSIEKTISSKGQEIDISANYEEAFRWACSYGHLHVAQWLQSLKPYLYVIEYDENGNYKGYKIRGIQEANMAKAKMFGLVNQKNNN